MLTRLSYVIVAYKLIETVQYSTQLSNSEHVFLEFLFSVDDLYENNVDIRETWILC